jgi:glycosyltransferase involved in cell wall biosynthesis
MKLSVIMVCLNEAKTMRDQLDALTRQDPWDEGWDVIVADNGSSDGSQDIARSYADRLNITVLDASQIQGSAHARNTAATAATGEGLLFIDADDVVADDWLVHMGNALKQHEFIAARLEFRKLNTDWVYHSRGRPQEKKLAKYPYGDFFPHAFGASLGIHKVVHASTTGFDTRLLRGQDMEYCWRIQAQGVKLVYVPEAVVHYRFRTAFQAIYDQAYRYAIGNMQIYKIYLDRYEQDKTVRIPPKPTLDLKKLAYLLVHYLRIKDDQDRGSWMWNFGWELGLIRGAWRYKISPF